MERDRTASPPLGPTLLTWFLPGSGHALLGSWRTAAIGFVVVEGLYLLGFLLSGGLAFEFLDFELRGRFALVLTPEAGNVGAVLAHLMLHPLGGPGSPPPPPGALVHVGGMLTAASGVLNIVLMAHAHLLARLGGGGVRAADRTARDLALGWFVPGLGHLAQGRKLRSAISFGVVVGLFALGTALAGGTNLTRDGGFYYWSGQFLAGLPAAVAELAAGHPVITGFTEYHDAGVFFACLAGLLNALLLIDVYAWDESRALGRDPVADRSALARARRDRKSSKKGAKDRPEPSAASKHLVAPVVPTSKEDV
ncbi:MAG: DUF6677 family protein [Planctomycetota bacterium]